MEAPAMNENEPLKLDYADGRAPRSDSPFLPDWMVMLVVMFGMLMTVVVILGLMFGPGQ